MASEAVGGVHLWGSAFLPWRLAPGLTGQLAGILSHFTHMPSHEEARGVGTKNQTQARELRGAGALPGAAQLGTVQHGPDLTLTKARPAWLHLQAGVTGPFCSLPSAGRFPVQDACHPWPGQGLSSRCA